jgi:Tol biopolymer transport system component
MLAYTAGAGVVATSELRWFDRQGRRLGQLGVDEDVIHYNSYDETLSPNGRTLAISAFRSATADIWLVDVARDVASRFTSDDASELYPVWSPDGTELLFASNRGGFYNMYRKPVTGPGDERRLFESASHLTPTDWSQHGQTILFTSIDAKGQADIWRTSATGDGKPTPVLATRFNEYAARLSPDGQWMAYTSDESGRPEIYVQRFLTATGRVQISTQGGSDPRWRADGRELFYLAADRRLTSATVTTTSGLSVGRPMKLFDTIVDTSIGSIHAAHYTPTADGQKFLINVSAISGTPTTVVLNWAPWTKP